MQADVPGRTRRDVLAAAAALALAACAPPRRPRAPLPVAGTPPPAPPQPPPAPSLFAAPDLSRERVMRLVAARRPYRRGRIRLETERIGDTIVVHDWGHGGAGVSLALGSAEEVVRLVGVHARPPDAVTVVGAGVVGLAAALALADAGYRPRIVAERFSPDTTSDVAGGQWAPSLCAKGDTEESRAIYERVLARSRALVDGLVDRGVGVHRRDNWYPSGTGASLAAVSTDVLPPPIEHERLPFAGTDLPGAVRSTYLVEPGPFLSYLTTRLAAAGVPSEKRRIASAHELTSLGTRVVVCCVGLGGGELFRDPEMRPLKGHLLLFPPGDHPWLLSHGDGYVFPRSDAVVVGGSVESSPSDDLVDERIAERIRRSNAVFFGQERPSAVARASHAFVRAAEEAG